MSLKRARQIARAATKQGRQVTVTTNLAACNLHNPGRHKMSGHYVVVESHYDGAGEAARYLWA